MPKPQGISKSLVAEYCSRPVRDPDRAEVRDYALLRSHDPYRHVAATDEFKEIERLCSRAKYNEATVLRLPGTRDGMRNKTRAGKSALSGTRKSGRHGHKEQAALIAPPQAKLGVDK